jgi:hypothetical protein
MVPGAVIVTHSPDTAPADRVPPGFVVTVPEPLVGADPPVGPVQLAFVFFVHVAVNVGPDVMNLSVPSVKVVVAVPDEPLAVAT